MEGGELDGKASANSQLRIAPVKVEPPDVEAQDEFHSPLKKDEIITDDVPPQMNLAPIPMKLIEAATGKLIQYQPVVDNPDDEADEVDSPINQQEPLVLIKQEPDENASEDDDCSHELPYCPTELVQTSFGTYDMPEVDISLVRWKWKMRRILRESATKVEHKTNMNEGLKNNAHPLKDKNGHDGLNLDTAEANEKPTEYLQHSEYFKCEPLEESNLDGIDIEKTAFDRSDVTNETNFNALSIPGTSGMNDCLQGGSTGCGRYPQCHEETKINVLMEEIPTEREKRGLSSSGKKSSRKSRLTNLALKRKMREKRRNETPELREARLKKMREYATWKRMNKRAAEAEIQRLMSLAEGTPLKTSGTLSEGPSGEGMDLMGVESYRTSAGDATEQDTCDKMAALTSEGFQGTRIRRAVRETLEERMLRLEKTRISNLHRQRKETPEQRETRLRKKRDYVARKRLEFKANVVGGPGCHGKRFRKTAKGEGSTSEESYDSLDTESADECEPCVGCSEDVTQDNGGKEMKTLKTMSSFVGRTDDLEEAPVNNKTELKVKVDDPARIE